MASITSLTLKATIFLYFIASSTAARPSMAKSTLPERLKLLNDNSSSSTECWESLFALQSCTGEVILFFINGETYLGPDCCRAIRTVERHCWPSMLGSLGFTPEETDILRGYCDVEEDNGGGDDNDNDGEGGSVGPPHPHQINLTSIFNSSQDLNP